MWYLLKTYTVLGYIITKAKNTEEYRFSRSTNSISPFATFRWAMISWNQNALTFQTQVHDSIKKITRANGEFKTIIHYFIISDWKQLGHILRLFKETENKSADGSSKIIKWDHQSKHTRYEFITPHTSKKGMCISL